MDRNPDILGQRDIFGHPGTFLSMGSVLALKIKRGYNQTCHWYQNLPQDMHEPHAKFDQNWWSGFRVIREHNTDGHSFIIIRIIKAALNYGIFLYPDKNSD